jgi:hypothetical protein
MTKKLPCLCNEVFYIARYWIAAFCVVTSCNFVGGYQRCQGNAVPSFVAWNILSDSNGVLGGGEYISGCMIFDSRRKYTYVLLQALLSINKMFNLLISAQFCLCNHLIMHRGFATRKIWGTYFHIFYERGNKLFKHPYNYFIYRIKFLFRYWIILLFLQKWRPIFYFGDTTQIWPKSLNCWGF